MNGGIKTERPDAGIHGFFRSTEGRKFLRFVYTRYLNREKVSQADMVFGDTIIAKKIKDDQDNNENSTRSALNRWAAGTQDELWKNKAKNLRVMERLEHLLMETQETAEICHDRARTIRRDEFAKGQSFFFASHSRKHGGFELQNSLKRMNGVFEVMVERYRPRDNENISFRRGRFCRFFAPDDARYLLVQEFDLAEKADPTRLVFAKRHCGFAYVGAGNSIVRFMISHEAPHIRWLEVHSPVDPNKSDNSTYVEMMRREFEDWKSSDLLYYVNFIPVDSYSDDYLREFQRYTYNHLLLRKMDDDRAKFMGRGFSSVMWDIPL